MNIYEITPDEIERLDQLAFVDAVNHLLRAEASRTGIPPTGIHTNLQVNEPDAGIDGRVISPPAQESQWIPPGLSVWQMKSGNLSEGELRQEFEKPGVQRAIEQGGAYCVAIGVDYGNGRRQSREETLQKCFEDLGIPPRYRLLTASDLAAWGSEMPAIVLLPQFGHNIGGLARWDEWSQDPRHAVGFEADLQRQEIMQEIDRVEVDRTTLVHIRLEGQHGIGKTRLAMEAFRDTAAKERVLYASEPDDVPRQLFTWLAAHPTYNLVLVVDECDREKADYLYGQVLRCSGSVLLVTIGSGGQPDQARSIPEGVFVLQRMEEIQIRSIVAGISPTLHSQAVDFVVQACGGFVKLATALARAILRDPAVMSAASLARAYDVEHLLSTLIPDEDSMKVMKALALLSRIGWEGEVAAEGQVVTEFIGIAWPDAQDVSAEMIRQGYVSKQGRYRYVTPQLLAVWLALEVWEARGDEVLGLVPQLPTLASRKALLDRLADLGEAAIARQVVERLLAEDGLFPDVEALDDEIRADILGTLAMVAPDAGLRALERLLLHLPRDRLLAFWNGRRHTVWTLARLAWHPETFSGAARLLRLLAEAENESFVNNATGTWAGLFQTHLGGTAVPVLERHQILRETLENSSPELRKLGLKGLHNALTIHEMRTSESEHQRGRVIPPPWSPQTWQEEHDARRSALTLLDIVLNDADPEVAAEARQILIWTSRSLVRLGLADEVLARLEALPLRNESEKHGLWDLLKQILEWEADVLTGEQRKHIEHLMNTLMGDSFHDRVRRWVGQVSAIDHRELRERDLRPEDIAARLAEEGFQNPEMLQQELDWLNSADATYFYAFGHRLGELDSEHNWLPELVARSQGQANVGFLSAYLRGRADAGEEGWVQDLLDEWAETNEEMAFATFDATWRNEPGERAARRLINLVDKGWIPPAQLGQLPWGGWSKALPTDTFGEILDRVVRDDSPVAIEGGLFMLLQWLDEHPGQHAEVAQQAWTLLERPFALKEQGMVSFYWKNIAYQYYSEAPARIAQAVLSIYEEQDIIRLGTDDRMEILREALDYDREGVWPEIGKMLLREDEAGFRFRLSVREWGIEAAVGSETLLEWAKQHEPRGPRILADLATPLSRLARGLLIRYHDDERVGGALTGKFLSGTFSGPESAWLESKLAITEKWVQDSHPVVHKWASELVAYLEERIRKVRQAEEEESW